MFVTCLFKLSEIVFLHAKHTTNFCMEFKK